MQELGQVYRVFQGKVAKLKSWTKDLKTEKKILWSYVRKNALFRRCSHLNIFIITNYLGKVNK